MGGVIGTAVVYQWEKKNTQNSNTTTSPSDPAVPSAGSLSSDTIYYIIGGVSLLAGVVLIFLMK